MKENDLVKALKSVNIGSDAQNRIMNKVINNNYGKERVLMSKRKICTAAFAAVFVIGIAVYAASGIITTWYSSSSSKLEYTSLPSEKQCIDDVGFAPVLLESFENGYTFKDGSVVNNDLRDDSQKSVEKFKSLYFRYCKNGDELILSAEKYSSDIDNSETEIVISDGTDGPKAYYSSYVNKIVPPDYKQTAEDKKAEKNGELVFSYGSEKVEISNVQNLNWEYNGIHYTFTQIDGNLTQEELSEMAEELISK